MTNAQADPALAGLSSEQVAQRVARGEVNVDPDNSGRSLGEIVRANVFTRINAILGVFLVLVIITGSYRNGLFGLILIINSGIGIFQEVRAKRTLDQLSIIGEAKPSVRRDGTVIDVPTEELVLDDVVLLAPGDQVVVDGDVVEVSGLTVDESLLTGESDAIHKQVGDQVKSGSFVVAGAGAFRVTHVGADAYAAKLAKQAGEFTLVKSQLRAGIDSILKVVTYLLIPTGILVITNQLLVANHSASGWRDPILGMVGALVPMVPEGLILLTTVAFAVGVVRLGRRNCLVNELPAIEGLARVDVVCADKTGTLTEPGMQVDRIEPLGDQPVSDAEAALAALAAADANPNASMAAIAQAHPDDPGWEVSGIAPFDSAKKWSGVSFGTNGNWLLGAPDILLPAGSADARLAEEIGSTGLRLLLVARSDLPVDDARAPGTVTPVALVALRQKVRPDAKGALDYFASQGVSLKVISGDNATSVGAVAASLGLGDPTRAVDARQLPEDQPALADAVEQGTVFGRVLPDQKRAMVHALQSRKHTVAMTGDGVNDVLALKDADVGVAMGSGSSASRSVAQIVLLDNKFATLPSVVGEGRRVIGNIERVSRLYLTKTIYAVTLAFLIGLFGLGARFLSLPDISYPFQPIHITITAWFTIGIPSFVLSLAPNNERAQDGFVRRVLRLSVPSGLAVALSTFICYLLVRPGGSSGVTLGSGTETDVTAAQLQASTAALVTLIGSSLWVLVVIARPLVPWKVVLVTICFVAYVPIFGIPWLRKEFLLDPTNTRAMIIGGVFAVAGAALVELLQRVIQRRTE